MGFHQAVITRGVYGEVSKIHEEWQEAEDALNQRQYLMFLIELSDMVGAAAGVAYRYGVTLTGLRLLMRPQGEDSILPHLSLEAHLQVVATQIRLLGLAMEEEQESKKVIGRIVALCRVIQGMVPKAAHEIQDPEFLTRFADLRSQVAREEEETP